MPFQLRIPGKHYEAMIAHALAELPNECCGILAGGGDGLVQGLYRLVNQLASPVEYLSEPRSMFEAMRDLREHQWEVLAVYHSHPTSAPIPSKKDLAQRYSEDVVHLIISLQDGRPCVRGWWLNELEYREADWRAESIT